MLECHLAVPRAVHAPGCTCPAVLEPGRRGLLGLAAAGAAAFAAAGLTGGRGARAAAGSYDAMLLNCIDPRFTSGSYRFMGERQMRDRYSQFVVAGGPIGAVHPRFAAWHGAFWDNLDITCQLHGIRGVVALTHRDCGAAKLAFGEAAVVTPAAEMASHAEALRAFRAEVGRRKPELAVLAGVMALDGSVETVG